MKAVVSGASGFLGSKLVPELSSRGFDQVCGLVFEKDILVRLQEEHAENPHLSFIASDDWDGTKAALKEADVLIHCAFPRAQAAEYLAAGLKYGNDLFIAARDAGCKAVINISSQSVYDAYRDYAATEDSPLVLDTTYAVAKYASELMLDDIYEGLPRTSVRLASLIGPGFDQRVPNKMVKKALAGETVEIQGGNQVFDYMDIRDAVDALCTLANSDATLWNPVFNLGSMQPVTLIEMAELVKKALQATLHINVTVERMAEKHGSIQNSSLDSNGFYEALEWRPEYSIGGSISTILIDFPSFCLEHHGTAGR